MKGAEREEAHKTIGFRRRCEKQAQAAEFLKDRPLLVGLDLAKKHHAVWFADREGAPIRRFMILNSAEGLRTLLCEAGTAQNAGGFDRAIAFMEPTSYYWQNVAYFLERQGIAYRTIAPIAVDREREIAHITYAKGDYRDAELIARLGARGQWLHRALEDDPVWRTLRALAQDHEILLAAQTSEKPRVRALLGLALPEFLEHFADPFGKTAQAVLTRFAKPVESIPSSFVELCERLRCLRVPYLRRSKLAALADRLEAGPSFGVESALATSLARIGRAIERYQSLQKQREGLCAELVEAYRRTDAHVFLDSIPGVGPVSNALLLAYTGDLRQYDRSSCLVKLAGIEPRENESGSHKGSNSISRRGVSTLRHILYRVVLGLRQGNPEFAAYLHRLRTRDTNRLSWHQAAVAAGNKYLRLMHRLCNGEMLYRPEMQVMRPRSQD